MTTLRTDDEKRACAVPLIELLRRTPKDAILRWQEPDGLKAHCSSPIGLRAHEAATRLVELLKERDEARNRVDERVADLELALDLALNQLSEFEPGDSRAVSNEFVAMAAIRCEAGSLSECRDIIRAALTEKHNG
jgi:hypothetical protein